MQVYSHSRLSTFENCPFQYKLSYIERIERDEESIEAFLGSRFHDVMELLYRDLKFKVYSLKELLEFYKTEWEKKWHDSIIITRKGRTEKDYFNSGTKFIENYYKRYYPFDSSRVLGLERLVTIRLDKEGIYKLTGRIDRIGQAEDNTYEVHDYKTSGHLLEQKSLDEDRQLAFYQISIQDMWNDVRKVHLIWHYVAFDKEMISTRTTEQLEVLKTQTIKLIDTIESTKEFKPVEGDLCDWCVFPDLCPRRKHYYKVEALPVNEYLKDNGVQLVNKYLEFSSKKKEYQKEIDKVELEIDKLKEAAIQYGEKEGVEVITGSEYQLKILEKPHMIAPSKGSPERKELDGILHKADKWDEVSELDTYAMDRVLKEERWDKKFMEKVKKFFKIETKKQVSLSKFNREEE